MGLLLVCGAVVGTSTVYRTNHNTVRFPFFVVKVVRLVWLARGEHVVYREVLWYGMHNLGVLCTVISRLKFDFEIPDLGWWTEAIASGLTE